LQLNKVDSINPKLISPSFTSAFPPKPLQPPKPFTILLSRLKTIQALALLAGYTGSGKTEILRDLKSMGDQVLDLELIANHRGSAFGALGQLVQPSSSQFHNLIYEAVKDFNAFNPIWIESESVNLGKAYMPKELWETMKNADGFEILLPIEERIKHTLKLYGEFDSVLLSDCVKQLKKRLGHQEMQELCDKIEIGELEPVVIRLLRYYDKAYELGREKRNCQSFVKLPFEKLNSMKIAEFLHENLMRSNLSNP
jgi:tRNA 2-selenouridine synthase